jgi:hypothetical protein
MSVRNSNSADGFAAGTSRGVLPLVIWAAHFFLSYASAEIACALDLQRVTLAGIPSPSIWLWMLTVAAIAFLIVLMVLAVQNEKARAVATSGSTLATVRVGAAILALVGVLWSAVPIVFAPLCGR